MQEQKKSSVTYWLNGRNISKEEFSSLVGEYFKYFDSGSVKAVDYSIIESLFDGEHKSQRQINDHLKSVLEKDNSNNSFIPGFGFSTKRGDTLNYQKHSSTRHKYSGEGDFHRCPNLSTEEMKKAINNLENRKVGTSVNLYDNTNYLKYKKCSNNCFCDGSCKKEIEVPFGIQVPKPKDFNQANLFDKKQQEQEIVDTFKRNMEKVENKGVQYRVNFTTDGIDNETKEFYTINDIIFYLNNSNFIKCWIYSIHTGEFIEEVNKKIDFIQFPHTPKESKNKIGVKESQIVKKAPIFTYCRVNSLALEALALRALYGHEKYKETDQDWQNFLRVPNAEEEYSNALFRHTLNIGKEETEEEHLVASAWNAVARLEVFLRNKNKNLHK